MSEILQTQQGQDVRYGCSLTGQAITGQQVLDTLPASFVDEQVQFVATATALQEDLAGVGSSDADLQNYFAAHSAQFDTVCLTAAVFSSETAAEAGAPEVASGTPFATVAASTSSRAAGHTAATSCPTWWRSCRRTPIWRAWPPAPSRPPSTTTGPTCCSRSPRGRRRRTARRRRRWSNAVQQAGSTATQKALTADERRSSVSVEPAVRGLGARERVGAHPAHARAVRRAERDGQPPRGDGRHAGTGLVGAGLGSSSGNGNVWSGQHGYGYDRRRGQVRRERVTREQRQATRERRRRCREQRHGSGVHPASG